MSKTITICCDGHQSRLLLAHVDFPFPHSSCFLTRFLELLVGNCECNLVYDVIRCVQPGVCGLLRTRVIGPGGQSSWKVLHQKAPFLNVRTDMMTSKESMAEPYLDRR